MSRFNKILISIVTVFTVASIVVTYYVINSNSQNNKNNEEKQVEPIIKEPNYGDIIVNENANKRVNDNVKGFSSFLDTLLFNPITLDNQGVLFGLKDKAVEKSITAAIQKELTSNKVSIETNYNNVISVGYSELNNPIILKFLTFRLDTGEKLKFEELFTSNANIVQFLSLGIYETLVWQACDNNMSIGGRYCDEKATSDIDYVAIEEESFRLINYYKTNGISEFGISQGYIYFSIDSKWYKTFIGDQYKDIAVYNRFNSNKAIYEKSVNNRRVSTVFGRTVWTGVYSSSLFESLENGDIYYRHEKLKDNLYVEIIEMSLDDNTRKNMESVIVNVKDKASNNSEKAYYLIGIPAYDGTSMEFSLFEAEYNYFKNNIEEVISKVYKKTSTGLFPDIFSKYELEKNENFKKTSIQ